MFSLLLVALLPAVLGQYVAYSGSIHPQGRNDLCWDSGNRTPGTVVKIQKCNGGISQTFRFLPKRQSFPRPEQIGAGLGNDGYSLCVTVPHVDQPGVEHPFPPNGAPVIIDRCIDIDYSDVYRNWNRNNMSTYWTFSDLNLYDAAAYIDLTNGNTCPGTPLQIWDDGVNIKWTVDASSWYPAGSSSSAPSGSA